MNSKDMDKTAVPGRRWYLIAAGVGLVSMVVMGLFLFWRLAQLGDSLAQVVVPGKSELALAEPGAYTIFLEERSVVDGRVYVTKNVAGLNVEVRALPDNEPVPIRQVVANSTYELQGRTGRSVLEFDVAKPGSYQLIAGYDDARKQPRAVLAVGSGFTGELLTAIFVSLGIVLAGWLAALVIAVRTYRRRRRARAEMVAA